MNKKRKALLLKQRGSFLLTVIWDQSIPFTLSQCLPFGVRQKSRNRVHGTPISANII